jgi:DNA-binding IclR family transcriptional regulator
MDCRLQFRSPCPSVDHHKGVRVMLNDREKILSALREKPLKIHEVMKRANLPNEEACQSLLMKMRDEGSVKFDIHKGRWLIG